MPSSFRLEPNIQAQEQKLRAYMNESQPFILQMTRLMEIGTHYRGTLVDGHIQTLERVWGVPWAEKLYKEYEEMLLFIQKFYRIGEE